MKGRWVATLAILGGAAGCSSSPHTPIGIPSVPTTVASTTTAPTTAAPTTAAPTTAATTTVSGAATGPAAVSAARPCVGAPPPATYDHVVWIVMENRGLSDIVGSSSAPYLASLAERCGLATGYSGVSHPSLPNYIAMTSGSTQGIGDDSGPGSHALAAQSIFGLLGPDWRALQEAMPAPCDHSSSGDYATKHNPAVYYTAIAASCATNDVPMGAAPDVSARFTFITPDLCHDMHDCSTATGDRWLSSVVPQILDSAEYRAGRAALFVTWDENDSGGSRVATYVVAPSVPPGTRSAVTLSHYSLLRSTEEMLGLTPLLGQAATAADMRPPFHL